MSQSSKCLKLISQIFFFSFCLSKPENVNQFTSHPCPLRHILYSVFSLNQYRDLGLLFILSLLATVSIGLTHISFNDYQ